MRIISILASAAVVLGVMPASAQSFQPAVVSTSLPPMEALWHVRVALNVAALGCRDADETTTVAEYNQLIRSQAALLGAANDAISAHYKAQYGAAWENARERDMTRLYNYFAQPTAQTQFCATAKATLARIGTVDSRDLPGFALASLPALEEPFWPAPAANTLAAQPAGPAVATIAAVSPIVAAPGDSMQR